MLFRIQAGPQVIDDLVVERLAGGPPSPRAGELLDARAQAPEPEYQRRAVEFAAEGFAQQREENQFATLAGFSCEPLEIGFDNAGVLGK